MSYWAEYKAVRNVYSGALVPLSNLHTTFLSLYDLEAWSTSICICAMLCSKDMQTVIPPHFVVYRRSSAPLHNPYTDHW